jgi:uncharacterized protein YkwD
MLNHRTLLSGWAALAVALSLLLGVWAPGGHAIGGAGQQPSLNEAPVVSFVGAAGVETVTQASIVGVDTSSRSAVADYYNSTYIITEPALGTTGTIVMSNGKRVCTPGSTSASFKAAVLQRINYYRGMAGVPLATSIDADHSAKNQKGAIMYVANGAISHTPPDTWDCFNADAKEQAAKSNIAIGLNGWDAINGYMKDHWPGNEAVGHRRWILYPQTQSFGTGTTRIRWPVERAVGSRFQSLRHPPGDS